MIEPGGWYDRHVGTDAAAGGSEQQDDNHSRARAAIPRSDDFTAVEQRLTALEAIVRANPRWAALYAPIITQLQTELAKQRSGQRFRQDPHGPVAGPDGQPPYLNGAHPTMIDGAKVIPLVDDPPGFPPVGPGPGRDRNWKKYLNGLNPDGSRRVPLGTPPAALPKPEVVQNKGLRAIGAAGRQQGVSYAWGANTSVNGPTKGTLDNDPPDGDAHKHRDDLRTGFDCGGLVRFAVFQATGQDPFEHTGPPGVGTDMLDSSKYLTPIKGGIPGAAASRYAQPGDVLVFGKPGHKAFSGSDTQHTSIYLGNGVVIDAPESGLPVRAEQLQKRENQPTDILRPSSGKYCAP